jgi:hypothetical protein
VKEDWMHKGQPSRMQKVSPRNEGAKTKLV